MNKHLQNLNITRENITIRNLKHSAFASEETHCFEATVVVDGKPLLIASNDGHGGCDSYGGFGKIPSNEAYKIVKEIDEILGQEKEPEYGLPYSLELVVGDLVNKTLILRDLKRKMRTKLLALGDDGQLYVYKLQFKTTPKKVIDQIQQRDHVVVLNDYDDEALYEAVKDVA